MNRRNYLLGLTGAAGIGSFGIGTGALTAARLDSRDANISVSNDSESLVALVANPRVSGVDEVDSQLEISLSESGINVNSIYQFGLFDDEWDDATYSSNVSDFPLVQNEPEKMDENDEFGSAFLVQNRTNDAIAVEMHLGVNEDNGSEAGDTKFVFQTHYQDAEKDTLVYESDMGTTMGLTVDDLDPGESFGVSFLVDAIDGEVGNKLDASLSVEAGEIVDTN